MANYDHETDLDRYDVKPDLASLSPASLSWRTSSFSNGAGGMCVEVAPVDDGVVVRDSRNPLGPALAFSGNEWSAFVAGAKAGEFDDTVVA